MFLPTNRPFHSDVFAVVLEGRPKQRIDTLMAKEGGLSNQQNSSLICLKMPRAMLKYAYIHPIFSFSWAFFATVSEIFLPNIDSFQVKGLDVDALYISHIQVNQAQKQRRRTYRAHGRINRTFKYWTFCFNGLICFTRFYLWRLFWQLICHPRAT